MGQQLNKAEEKKIKETLKVFANLVIDRYLSMTPERRKELIENSKGENN